MVNDINNNILLHIRKFPSFCLNTQLYSKSLLSLKVTNSLMRMFFFFVIMQVDDTEVISFLLQTEIIPLCLRTMEMGSELSKTVCSQPTQFLFEYQHLFSAQLWQRCETFWYVFYCLKFMHYYFSAISYIQNLLVLYQCFLW